MTLKANTKQKKPGPKRSYQQKLELERSGRVKKLSEDDFRKIESAQFYLVAKLFRTLDRKGITILNLSRITGISRRVLYRVRDTGACQLYTFLKINYVIGKAVETRNEQEDDYNFDSTA